ncbi:MAG: hydrolase [Opitutales bacterium]|nr:hydrolase [Opitutales bacterium]
MVGKPENFRGLWATQEALVAELVEWAEINSGSDHPAGVAAMAGVISDSFGRSLPGRGRMCPVDGWRGLDGSERRVGAAYHHVCRPEAPVRLFFSGHLDTVYGVNDSFQHCSDFGDGRLHGPGVADMKGGLLIMKEALRLFESAGDRSRVGWEVLITADEEIGSGGSRRLIEEVARRCHVGFVFESALPDGALVRRRSGAGSFRATVRGRAAHTGRDFAQGRNAIVALADFVGRLHALNASVAGLIVNAGAIRGGGALNIVPHHAEADFNVRLASEDLVPVMEAAFTEARTAVEASMEGIRIELTGALTRPPKVETPEIEALHTAFGQCARRLGLEVPGWRDTGGGSDGNFLAACGLPHLDGVGARGGAIHSPDEFIIKESLSERILLMAAFLEEMEAGRDGLAFLSPFSASV